MFLDSITFKQVVLSESDLTKELFKAVITKLLIQIDRSEKISINLAALRVKQVLQLERQVTKGVQYDIIMNRLDQLFLNS